MEVVLPIAGCFAARIDFGPGSAERSASTGRTGSVGLRNEAQQAARKPCGEFGFTMAHEAKARGGLGLRKLSPTDDYDAMRVTLNHALNVNVASATHAIAPLIVGEGRRVKWGILQQTPCRWNDSSSPAGMRPARRKRSFLS